MSPPSLVNKGRQCAPCPWQFPPSVSLGWGCRLHNVAVSPKGLLSQPYVGLGGEGGRRGWDSMGQRAFFSRAEDGSWGG